MVVDIANYWTKKRLSFTSIQLLRSDVSQSFNFSLKILTSVPEVQHLLRVGHGQSSLSVKSKVTEVHSLDLCSFHIDFSDDDTATNDEVA